MSQRADDHAIVFRKTRRQPNDPSFQGSYRTPPVRDRVAAENELAPTEGMPAEDRPGLDEFQDLSGRLAAEFDPEYADLARRPAK